MPLCDTLFRAAEAELYQIHFSQEILEGATRNLVKNGKMTDAKAVRFQEMLKMHFPEAMVEVPEQLVASMTKDNQGEILRVENGKIQGSILSKDIKAFQRFEQSFEQELEQAKTQKSQT
ncbi:MAG: hypothetical protein V7K68_14815 [Nostoc sp.]|uniref:hypothetical protein n=1 Tax=Nostoc sp. TaxID=1180 RepID=UPI002FF998F8